VYNYLIIFCFTLFYTSVFYPRNFFERSICYWHCIKWRFFICIDIYYFNDIRMFNLLLIFGFFYKAFTCLFFDAFHPRVDIKSFFAI
jgi:hypothetical protein